MPRRPDLPPLRRSDLASDPIEQFSSWWERAEAEVPLPDAICLATVDSGGAPDARMVLLKGFGAEGFRFHTNYESAKGEQLTSNPNAAIVVYWRELDRQVRVRGVVERLSAEQSDEYFLTRPPERRVGAWASPQSRPLESRDELDERVREVEERFAGEEIPRPEHWGGFRLIPETYEFWEHEENRLHDRIRYRRDGESWTVERLQP